MNIKSEQDMLDFGAEFAQQLLAEGHTDTIIELIGDVGAGKTTFTRGFARGLGITQPITSPSFTISKSYAFPGGHTLTHYDFYRLDHPGLMLDDLRDAIKHHHLIIVEWGKTAKDILPKNRIKLVFATNDDGSREVTMKYDHAREPSSHSTECVRGEADSSNPRPKGRATRSLEPVVTGLGRSNGSPLVANGLGEAHLRPHNILYLDTSTPTTILKINDKTYSHEFANTLSQNLLTFLHDKLAENNLDWRDISSITFMSGPGSFTGLRIGAAVVNTLAHELSIPLYDHHGTKLPVILPDYGRAANIGKPKKV